jgi:16S rRNA (guanine966-N2)-methyltransferase
MFSSLTSQLSEEDRVWDEVSVLDLYAGSGALGLEAASRGAHQVALVERSRPAAAVIRRNVQACGLDQARVIVGSAADVASRMNPGPPFGLCLADPPYEHPADGLRVVLEQLAAHRWLEEGCIAVIERPTSDPESPLPADWTLVARRTYGDTALWYGRFDRGEASRA